MAGPRHSPLQTKITEEDLEGLQEALEEQTTGSYMRYLILLY